MAWACRGHLRIGLQCARQELTYQYSNFGVPGLGFKRGLSENLVIAPYARLATMVDPGAAAANFNRLPESAVADAYGFYEALDFTPSRLPEGQTVAVVRAYMATTRAMTVVASPMRCSTA